MWYKSERKPIALGTIYIVSYDIVCQLKEQEGISVGYYFDLASLLLLVSLSVSPRGFATVEHQVRAQSAGVDDLGGK